MKLERRSKIIELIGKYQIETQEELGERLEQEGFTVTQATISRDIRELKLTKVSVDGVHQKYTLLQEKETNLYKKLLPKNTKLCCAVGAVATPLLNTFWFMLSLCVFFFNTEYVQSLCATFGTTNPFLFVCAFVGVQALVEAVGCGIVATLVTVPLLKFLKK
mgnify:CR=1 FL=1